MRTAKNCETSWLYTQLLCYISAVAQVNKIILETVPMHYMDQKSPGFFRSDNAEISEPTQELLVIAFSSKKFRTLAETVNQGDKKALPDSFDHAESHFNTAVCMVLARFWEPRHTIVTIPQDLYSKTMMFLYTNISKRKKIFALFFHDFKVKVKMVEKLLKKKTTNPPILFLDVSFLTLVQL